jgi:hypothetical protein
MFRTLGDNPLQGPRVLIQPLNKYRSASVMA